MFKKKYQLLGTSSTPDKEVKVTVTGTESKTKTPVDDKKSKTPAPDDKKSKTPAPDDKKSKTPAPDDKKSKSPTKTPLKELDSPNEKAAEEATTSMKRNNMIERL